MTSNNRFDHDARGSHDRNRVYFVVFSRVRDERFRRFEFSSRGVDILCIWIHDISGFMTYHHMILTYLNFTYVFIFLDMNFDFFTSETRIRNVPDTVDRWYEDLPISFNEHVHCWQIHLIHLYHPQLFELSKLHSVLDFFWDFTPEISQTSKCRNDEIIVFGRETPCHIGAVKWHKIRSIRPLYIKLNIHVFNIFKTGFNKRGKRVRSLLRFRSESRSNPSGSGWNRILN